MMNKRTQIGLVLVITLILLLGLTVPSMARQNPKFSCFINPIIVNNNGEVMTFTMKVYGDLEAYWTKVKGVDTLVNICTGNLPMGEPINPSLTYADFDVYCDMFDVSCEGGVLTYEDHDLGKIWDPDGGYYTPDSRTFILNADGTFSFTNIYTP